MNEEWFTDARKIPDEVMDYVRKIAVRAIIERRISPELVAKVFRISRTAIYDWLRRYDRGGYEALNTIKPPGVPCVITPKMEIWIKNAVLHATPKDYGYDTALWTRKILAELLKKWFDIDVGVSAVGVHLAKLGLSSQKPWFRPREQDQDEVDHFVKDTFPRIQRLAKKMDADIGFEDEAGIGLQTHSGKTWGEIGKTPEVPVSGKRGGYNMLSAITTTGILRFSVQDRNIDSDTYIRFLKRLLQERTRPLILIIDRASFHCSNKVRAFVRSHRKLIRIYFFPKYSPEMNPDEQVWNTVKSQTVGKQAAETKSELKTMVYSALRRLQHNTNKVLSFFHLDGTKYLITECTDTS